ncbi:hypothetical protein [Algoriphagus sp.]|uniref:hypothetical protein n=1 Tax=Algoriphagus sp. TaxID=1872435 RepID=UPI003918CBED
MKNKRFTLFGLLILSLFLCSCKAYRNVENLKPRTSEEIKEGPFDKSALNKLVPGDEIILFTISGFRYNMTYSNVNGVNIRGSIQKVNKSKILVEEIKEIPIDEIETLYVRRVSAAATAPLVALGGLGISIAIVAISWSNGGGFGWKEKSHPFEWLFAKYNYRKSISDFREIKGFQKLRGEVSGFELLIFQ